MHFRDVYVVLFVAGALFACRADAQETPSVDELRAKIAAATGSPPPASREIVHTRAGGGIAASEIIRAGDDFRENDGNGPLQTARGVYHGQAWHENANGQVVLDESDPGNAVGEKLTTTVERVTAPLRAYVIAQLNRDGNGTKEFVDPDTSRVVRREVITPTKTTVTTYDDFETDRGYTTARHWTSHDGRPEDDTDVRIVSFTAVPADKDAVSIPPPRRALVEFPPGKTSVELPVTFRNNTFYVRVVINGRGLDFLLDSGASGIFMNDQVAKQLGFAELARGSNDVNAGRFAQAALLIPELDIGDLRMHDIAVSTVPGLPQQDGDISVAGLLGFDFIAELMLRLDYERGHVTAFENGSMTLPHESRSVAVDIRLGDQIPMTSVVINGAVGDRFMLDTGAQSPLLIFDYFARRNPGAMVDLGRGSSSDRNRTYGYGVGGRVDVVPYQLQKVQLGNVTFADFFGYRVAQRTAYAGNVDGLIGQQFLRNFTVWLDYVDSECLLVLNANGAQSLR